MLLDAGADAAATTTQGSTACTLAANAGHRSVAMLLRVVERMPARGEELSPGHSHLEMCGLIPGREEVGDRCPKCDVHVPPARFNDHVASHLWEGLVKSGALGGRDSDTTPASSASGPIPPGKVAVFAGSGMSSLSELAVTADWVMIRGVTSTETIPLESIQSVGVSGLLWKHLDIRTSGYVHQWESGLSDQKADEIKRLILDARQALIERRRSR